jgi:hypothetical protein
MNRSEKFTYELCKKSFLSLWSFATPHLQNRKELCDILVVSDPYVIIFSVKEIRFADNALEAVALERWRREAVDKSVRQIYSAQGRITRGVPVYTDQEKPIFIPDLKSLVIHRVAVALGSKGKASIESRDFGKGFVHVYDEESVYLVLRELDTITDFVDYLTAVESLLLRGDAKRIELQGGHEDLLALYLLNNRSFPQKFNALIVGNDLWNGFEKRPEVMWRREQDKISSLWDALLETLARHESEGTWEFTLDGKQAELALRTMARENRFNRRVLAEQMDEILRTTPQGKSRGRLIQSSSGIVYVFLLSGKGYSREERRAELASRCFVARDVVLTSKTVVGIATETYNPVDPGFSFDVCYFHSEDWTPEEHAKAQETREKYGWFPQEKQKHVRFDEYPATDEEKKI